MAYQERDGDGVLFVNDPKGNDRAPTHRGRVLLGGKRYTIAGWKKIGSKSGEPFISLRIEPEDQTRTR